uniref:Transposase n=1 Tax=Ditylenchus dipsaci TaxID=166011 RepID=A0A915D0F6_9BILA
MDETAVWFDCPSSRCIDSIGDDVTIVTTGHEKMRITVCLTARSNGKKLIPYVLVDRKRSISKVFEGRLVIKWNVLLSDKDLIIKS